MKKRGFYLIACLLMCLIMCACSARGKENLKIYIVDRTLIDDNMTSSEIVSLAYDRGRLAFDGNDIEGYQWSGHVVRLKDEAVPSLGSNSKEDGGSTIFKSKDTDIFILVINKTFIYYGGFEMGTTNPQTPLQPNIKDAGRYTFSINFDSKYAEFSDPRNSEYLYRFLSENEILVTKAQD